MPRTFEKIGKQLKVVETNTQEGLMTIKQLRNEIKRLKAAKHEYLARIDATIDDRQALLEQAITLGVEEEQEVTNE